MCGSGAEDEEVEVRGHRPDRRMGVRISTAGRTRFGFGSALRWRARPGALWRTGILFSLLCLSFSQEEECVLGIVGRPVLLPCVHPEFLPFGNVSVEWKRNDEVVLRSVWERDKHTEMWGYTLAKLSDDAALTGNLSLELLEVHPQNDNTSYGLFLRSEQNDSGPLCSMCLRTAASFSFPQLHKEEGQQGAWPVFSCQSSGGYPEPRVFWIINGSHEPPEGAVRTRTERLPDSQLFNVSSHMTLNVSNEATVTCSVHNPPLNQTLTATVYGVAGGPVVTRASEAMWMFSTGLCVVVGVMVIVGVAYQIHLDRVSKRKKKEFQKSHRGYKRRRCDDEADAMKMISKETDL